MIYAVSAGVGEHNIIWTSKFVDCATLFCTGLNAMYYMSDLTLKNEIGWQFEEFIVFLCS